MTAFDALPDCERCAGSGRVEFAPGLSYVCPCMFRSRDLPEPVPPHATVADDVANALAAALWFVDYKQGHVDKWDVLPDEARKSYFADACRLRDAFPTVGLVARVVPLEAA